MKKGEIYDSTKLCGLNILSVLKEVLRFLDIVAKIVHINGDVNIANQFYD